VRHLDPGFQHLLMKRTAEHPPGHEVSHPGSIATVQPSNVSHPRVNWSPLRSLGAASFHAFRRPQTCGSGSRDPDVAVRGYFCVCRPRRSVSCADCTSDRDIVGRPGASGICRRVDSQPRFRRLGRHRPPTVHAASSSMVERGGSSMRLSSVRPRASRHVPPQAICPPCRTKPLSIRSRVS
jgi:hypothetical protein